MISMKSASQEDFIYNKSTRLSPKRKKKTSSMDFLDYTPKSPYKKQKRKITARTWDEHVEI